MDLKPSAAETAVAEIRPDASGHVCEADVSDAVRRLIRLRHYSHSTEQTYLSWIGRFFRYLAACGNGSGEGGFRIAPQEVKDLAAGCGEVALPDALCRKYPNAAREWCWQYVFPSRTLSVDPRDGKVRRWHVSDTSLQKAVHGAVRAAGISKPASVHSLRHSFATSPLDLLR